MIGKCFSWWAVYIMNILIFPKESWTFISFQTINTMFKCKLSIVNKKLKVKRTIGKKNQQTKKEPEVRRVLCDAVVVVLLSAFRIAEQFVSPIDFDEFVFSVFVRILVRMPFLGKLLVGFSGTRNKTYFFISTMQLSSKKVRKPTEKNFYFWSFFRPTHKILQKIEFGKKITFPQHFP